MGPTAAGYEDANAASDEAARLAQAREQLQLAKDRDRNNEEAMHEDALFLVGGRNQWDERAIQERERAGRPIFTGNLFPPLLAQITGEIRRNKPGIVCTPGDSDATQEAAEVFEGLIRSIERLSQANLVYAGVGKQAAAIGKSHLRIVPVYADDESFDVELRIRRIKNAYSVKWDPAAQAPDKSDANWCYVVSEVDKKAFEEAYPTVGEAAWAKAQTAQRKLDGWRTGDGGKVTVCEQWVVKKEPFERYRLHHARPSYRGVEMFAPSGQEITIDGEVGGTIDGFPAEQWLQAAHADGFDVIQTRTAYKRKICMYLWGGEKQIAGPIEWKGARIPIFTCVGEEIDVGEDTVEHGIIRHAKDDQRSYNYARSAQLELVSQAPKAPIMVSDKQIEGWEDVWVLAQKQPVPYLPYNETQAGAPKERSGPQANSGPSELAQLSLTGVKDTTGIQDAALGKKSNETSGIAIQARDAQVDTGTFVYLDNLNATIEAVGAELVAAIPHYYSTRKQITILGQDDTPAIVELSKIKLNLGKYHVICKRGPSYQTKREKSAELLMQMAQAAPPWAQPSIFMRIAKLIDMPDADDFIGEIRAIGEAIGQLPPSGAAPGMPPGMPGMPPPGGAPLPPNVIPFGPQGQGAPPPPDPLADLSVSPPRAVPAARPRVGDGPRPAAPPGI